MCMRIYKDTFVYIIMYKMVTLSPLPSSSYTSYIFKFVCMSIYVFMLIFKMVAPSPLPSFS